MDSTYYDTVKKLEAEGVAREYIQGWVGGYLGNPKREEQRLSEAYEVGYEDGSARVTEHAGDWPG